MFTVGSRHLDAGGGREQSLFKIVNPVPQPNFPPSQASVPIEFLVFYRTVQSVTTENVSKIYRIEPIFWRHLYSLRLFAGGI